MSPDRIEVATDPLTQRALANINKAGNTFLNKDGVGPPVLRIDTFGRFWTVDVQPFNSTLLMFRYKNGVDGMAELATVTGYNSNFHYLSLNGQIVRLHGREAVKKVEQALDYVIENTRNATLFDQ